MKLPEAVQRLIHQLSDLPGIGPRQATRLAFHLVNRGPAAIRSLAEELGELETIKICERCFFVHENKDALCDTCKNPARDQRIIMVVEKETDLLSIENTGKFTGRYLVLGAIPRTGLLEDAQKLRLQNLRRFIEKELGGPSASSGHGKAEEIILGMSPTHVGDFNATLVARELAPLAKKMTRLGRGLPTGGEIEFADDETLGSALERRT